ncbi:BRCT domain-containing protein [Madurella fahalii]|uniref:BRCT domain-containing protein n=1 Tax=Madurella fahalii TaxID=1157608 RepID=A0ABQ0FZL3_9PEZI
MTSPSFDEKVAFFNALDALDNDEDEELDDEEREHRDKCRAFFNSEKRSSIVEERAPSQLRRTTSMPAPDAVTPGSCVIATPAATLAVRRDEPVADATSLVIEETPVPETVRPLLSTLRRSTTLPLPPTSSAVDQSPSASSALRKRKRQSSTKTMPQAPQIFRGLSFYYIPNNDVAPARKLRIAKAQEFGAQWVRSLDYASHVIVDQNLTYNDIKDILGSAAADSLVVVNEEYPIDSIAFRTLLNPDQNRYKVPGRPTQTQATAPEEDQPVPSHSLDRSLQVKEPRTSRRRESNRSGRTKAGSEQPSVQREIMGVKEGIENPNLPKGDLRPARRASSTSLTTEHGKSGGKSC